MRKDNHKCCETVSTISDQRLGRRCSRLDNTFKGTRVPVKAKIFLGAFLYFSVNILTTRIHW